MPFHCNVKKIIGQKFINYFQTNATAMLFMCTCDVVTGTVTIHCIK